MGKVPTPLSEQQILASLSPLYHAQYAWLKKTRLQSDEAVFAVADCSFPAYGTEFGFVVVSAYRILKVEYQTREIFGRSSKLVYKEGGGFFSSPMSSPERKCCWFDLSSPLSRGETGRRRVVETQLKLIQETDRRDFAIRFAGERLALTELIFSYPQRFGSTYLRIVLATPSAKSVYDLIQTAAQSNDQILTVETRKETGIPGLIDSLARLHQAGVLTDQEFEQKKQELLKRL